MNSEAETIIAVDNSKESLNLYKTLLETERNKTTRLEEEVERLKKRLNMDT
jgi:hypothetical protein